MKRIISLLSLVIVITVMAGIASAKQKLTAGQNTDVGWVTVWTYESTLFVVFNTAPSGWEITETHLHVATSLDDIPHNKKGSPTPGHFQFDDEDAIPLTPNKVMYKVPLEWDAGTELYIAAHAVVQQVDEFGNVVRYETAWAHSDCPDYYYEFPGSRWAAYFKYTVPIP